MIAACLKWVDQRPEVDRLTGAVSTDDRTTGPSDADQAALELALRLADASGAEVVAITAAPIAAEAMLRDALAAGATLGLRVELDVDAPSEHVAAALAGALPAEVDVIVCGTWSSDRGSGSAPAHLAAPRGAAPAPGLTALDWAPSGWLSGERRLDGGRRERVRLSPPVAVSVEG